MTWEPAGNDQNQPPPGIKLFRAYQNEVYNCRHEREPHHSLSCTLISTSNSSKMTEEAVKLVTPLQATCDWQAASNRNECKNHQRMKK